MQERQAVELAQLLLHVLDEGRRTGTHKLVTLLALSRGKVKLICPHHTHPAPLDLMNTSDPPSEPPHHPSVRARVHAHHPQPPTAPRPPRRASLIPRTRPEPAPHPAETPKSALQGAPATNPVRGPPPPPRNSGKGGWCPFPELARRPRRGTQRPVHAATLAPFP